MTRPAFIKQARFKVAEKMEGPPLAGRPLVLVEKPGSVYGTGANVNGHGVAWTKVLLLFALSMAFLSASW